MASLTATTGPRAPVQGGRVVGIDRLRGLAITGMIVSHALAAFPTAWGNVARASVLRPIAPIFLVVAGALIADRTPRPRTVARIAVAAAASEVIALAAGLQTGHILGLFVGLLLVWHIYQRYPALVVFGGLTFALNAAVFPWPWTYQPGAALGLMFLGAWVGRDTVARVGGRLPRVGLEVVGRYPLSFYLGHLGALAVLEVARGG